MYLWLGAAVLIILGGILGYSFGTAISSMTSALTAMDPAHYSGSAVTFTSSVWYWMPAFILFLAVVYVVVNSTKEAYTR